MVKMLGLELTGASLALRLILGALLSAGGFLIFYYLPANFVELASSAIGGEVPPAASGLLSSLIDPALPLVGLALVAAIFLCAVFRGTKAYGPVTIALSLVYALYVVLLFHGGAISISVPADLLGGGLPFGASLSVSVDMPVLMVLFLVPALLGIVKGFLLILMTRRR
ncbi:MAG: hypothetical protein QFX34_04455 [Candidatus Verstraetearchaeota archaeon]|nr:hypothetical protein [Candidatus Verstraetearchaeota archaeon]